MDEKAFRKNSQHYAQSRAMVDRIRRDLHKMSNIKHCNDAIDAIVERMDEIKRGINVALSPKMLANKWRNEVKGSLCKVCGKRIKFPDWCKYRDHDLSVVAFVDGQEVTVRACTEKCRDAAWERFERELKCLQQQTREMENVKRVAASMKAGLAQMSREARNSQPKESEPPATSPR